MNKIFKNIIPVLLIFSTISNVFAQINVDEQLAAQFFHDKEFDKSASLYEKLFNKNPNTFYYSNYLDCLLELKNFKKAEKLIKKQIKQNPYELRYLVDMGYVYTRAENIAKAKKQFTKAIKELNANQQRIIDLANAFLLRNQTDYAIKTYKKGELLLQTLYPFNLKLADIYEDRQDYHNMINEYLNLLEFNPDYQEEIQNKLQISLAKDPDNKKNDILKKSLLKKIQKNPNNTYFSEMLLWLSIQQHDFKTAFTQAISLDKRFKEDGSRLFNLARLCASNKDYDIAAKSYEYIIKKGVNNYYYLDSKIELLNVKYLKITSSFNYTKEELISLENDYISILNEFGIRAETIPLIRNLAHLQAFYLDEVEYAKKLLNKAIAIKYASKKLQAECKTELADILLMSDDVWEATLLYSQVEKDFKNESLGHLAKFKNAKLFYYIGEFKWAKAQLDVLKAATSKLIANDAMDLSLLINDNIDEDSSTAALSIYSRADLLSFQNKDSFALLTLDSINILFPGHQLSDEVLYKKAQIKLKHGLYMQADTLLQQIVELYYYDILADDALFKLAELNEKQFHDKAKAMLLYQDILVKFPDSLYAVEARKRFRKLRGDSIN